MGLVGLAALCGGCGLIDEELVNCPQDITVDYHVRLVTNKTQELDAKLGTAKDRPLRMAIEDYLSGIFVDTAHDADLSFYVQPEDERTMHASEIWNASGKTFELKLLTGDYNNLVAANLSGNGVVQLAGDETSAGSFIKQKAGEVVESHSTGIFTARKAMQIVLDRKVAQHFEVDLFMANDAGGLLLNVDACENLKDVRCELEGLADGFKLLDSTYTYDAHTMVKADLIDAQPYTDLLSANDASMSAMAYEGGRWDLWTRLPVILCGVGFSSREISDTRIDGKPVYWIMHLYVTLTDGSVTKSTIYVGEPLPAANLKLIKGWLLKDGSFTPETDPELDTMLAGVDVQLDWTPGPQFDPIL